MQRRERHDVHVPPGGGGNDHRHAYEHDRRGKASRSGGHGLRSGARAKALEHPVRERHLGAEAELARGARGEAKTWRTSPRRYSPVTRALRRPAASASAVGHLEDRARLAAGDVEGAGDRARRGRASRLARATSRTWTKSRSWPPSSKTRGRARPRARCGRCSPRPRTACRRHPRAVDVVVAQRGHAAPRSPARTPRRGAPGGASSRRRRCAGRAARPRRRRRARAARRRGHGGSKPPGVEVARRGAGRARPSPCSRAPVATLAVDDHAARQHEAAGEAARRSAPAAPRCRGRCGPRSGDVVEVDAEPDHRGLVADRVDAARPRDGDGGRDVAHEQLGAADEVRARRRAPREQRVDGTHLVAVREEGVDDVGADEPAPPVTRIGTSTPGSLSQRSAGRRIGTSFADVILPVLERGAALPWVLDRMPAGYAPIVVDNGSTDGSGESRPRRRAGRARAAAAGSAPPASRAWRGLGRRRVLHGLRRLASTRASSRGWRTRSRPARPTSCSAPATRSRGVAAPRAPGQPGAGGGAPAAHRRRPARSRPDARGVARGAARPRAARPALRLAARDGRARRGGGMADRGGRRRRTCRVRAARR